MNVLCCWVMLVLLQVIVGARPLKDYCIFQNATRLACRKHLPNISPSNNVTILELYNLDWDVLDLNKIIEKFPSVENVTVYGRNICGVVPPVNVSQIKVLQLQDLKITNISQTFLENFPKLEVFSLERNRLQSLHKNFSFGNVKTLRLLDNKWNCSKDLSWVLKLNKTTVENWEDLVCHGEPYTGKPLLPIAQFSEEIKQDCPTVCDCTLPKVVRDPETELLEPIVEVNCSERGLTELPSNFPSKTKILHLEGNDITDLSPLRLNRKYRSVLDLYLDNNQIKSIGKLEGSHWLTHFRVLSLSGNKLTELPSYALDNALQQNTNMPNAVRITLGANPWRCDCAFTPVFQEMLQKYAPQVKDVSDVKCSYVEGDENSLLPIVDLSRSSVCRLPSEYSLQEALDLLNAVLGCLIVLVLGKLAYDYYHFKKTGRVPWIVTKMP